MSTKLPLSHGNAFPCAMRAWSQHEQPLMQWLFTQTHDKPLVQDIVQEVFIKVMQQQQSFCEVSNSKAWIFRVARNLLIDHSRKGAFQSIDTEIEDKEPVLDAVDLLALSCLPRVVSELDKQDREIILSCDLEGVSQEKFANLHGLSLPATKSRIRRARAKLKKQIESSCKVKFDEKQQVCCFTSRDKI